MTIRTEEILKSKEHRFISMTEDELRDYAALWYPGGSGPISAMYDITALLRVVAKLQGYDINKQ